MSEPLVSIIIPVYNGGNYLRDAIDSALAQTYSNVEVIVINDGSNDGRVSEEIALSYGEKIRYYYKENGGVATALNLGIEKMKGAYFSWLSHDDMYYPEKINKQIKALYDRGDPEIIVSSDFDVLDEESQELNRASASKTYEISKLENSIFPILEGVIHGCTLLIHRSHFERVGEFDSKLLSTQDYDLWFRMFRDQRTIYVPESLVVSRRHKEQGSRTLSYHDKERTALYMKCTNSVTEDEMYSMYGSPYNFYFRMGCLAKEKMDEFKTLVYQEFQEVEVPEDLSEKRKYLNKYISDISGGRASRICIFCIGEYGQSLYLELCSKGISVEVFSDNNEEKWDRTFDGINCVSPEKLRIGKDETVVIVANLFPKKIINQLRDQGFPYLITKQELDRVLFDTPPLAWYIPGEHTMSKKSE